MLTTKYLSRYENLERERERERERESFDKVFISNIKKYIIYNS